MIDYNEVLARLELIASVLRIPDEEIARAYAAFVKEDMDEFVNFAKRYGQSLDWIILGNVRGMIATKAMLRPRP